MEDMIVRSFIYCSGYSLINTLLTKINTLARNLLQRLDIVIRLLSPYQREILYGWMRTRDKQCPA